MVGWMDTVAVVAVVAFAVALVSVCGRRLPIGVGSALLAAVAAIAAGAAAVGHVPWIVVGGAMAGGVVFALALGRLVRNASADGAFLVFIAALASCVSMSAALTLRAAPPGAFGDGTAFLVAVSGCSAAAAAIAAASIVAMLRMFGAVRGPLAVPFSGWWAPAGISIILGVTAVVASDGASWSGLVAVVFGALGGVALTIASPVAVERLIPGYLVACGVTIAVLGTSVSAMPLVVMGGLMAGVAFAVRSSASVWADPPGARKAVALPELTARDAAVLLADARRVVLIPGYDVVVDGAVPVVSDVAGELRRRGAAVSVIAHPAAGRLPGHMYSVLSDAGVDPDLVITDLPSADAALAVADVAVVMGDGATLASAEGLIGATGAEGFTASLRRARQVLVLSADSDAGWEPGGVADGLVSHTAVVPGGATPTLIDLRAALHAT